LLTLSSDTIAELEVPRSGVEPLADKMPLPRSIDPDEHDDMICFVAETAVRRLLNRIHSALYGPDSGGSLDFPDDDLGPYDAGTLNKQLAVSSELNRQLEEWYGSIPGKLRPPIGTESVASRRGKVLRIRYYTARQIIHRPFVLAVAVEHKRLSARSSPGPSTAPPVPTISRVILEKCEACIASCTAYLCNVIEILERRSLYLWGFSQGCVACLVVLLLADSCPQLRPFTPDVKQLQTMIVKALRRWATPGSSFEAEVKIVENLNLLERFEQQRRQQQRLSFYDTDPLSALRELGGRGSRGGP